MSEERDNMSGIHLIKRDGKLMHRNKGSAAIYNEFIKSMQEGQIVEILMTSYQTDGSNLQLAKIHACIRKLASEIGYTFEAMKLEITRRSGLVTGDLSKDGHAKSFADCSVEELALVIETIIESGDFVNINFRGKLPEAVPRGG